MIRAIAAIDDRRGIAKDGVIPWNIPDDTQYYRQKTEHSVIVMGAATYQGFINPLVNRRNIVVSHSLHDVRKGFELVSDIDAFLRAADQDIWIIGGAGLYASTIQYCQQLYITHVRGDFKCDRFFPAYDNYILLDSSTEQQQNNYHFRYAIYEKPVGTITYRQNHLAKNDF